MIIKSIHLQNYRRYEDQVIEFPDGLIGVVGVNGAGKSTLIEAVGWCLYGNVAARTDKEFIKRTSAKDDEDCRVIVEVILGEDSVRIERELRGQNSSGTCRLFLNGNSRHEVSGMKDVSEYVARKTGMDHVAFFTSIFAKQKELNALSSMDAAERKKTIMRLLRIDKIDAVIAQIRADSRDSKAKIDILKPTLKDIDVLQQEGEQLIRDKVQKSGDIKSTSQECAICKKAVTDEKRKFVFHEKKSNQHNKLDKLLEKLTSTRKSKDEEKTTTDSDLESAKQSEQAREDLDPQLLEFHKAEAEKSRLDSLHVKFTEKTGIEGQIAKIGPQIEEKVSKNSGTEQKLNSYEHLDSELKKSLQRIQSLRKTKVEVEALANRLKERINDHEKRKVKAEADFFKIKHLGKNGRCPTCSRPLGTHLSEILNHFTDEIGNFQKDIKKAKDERKEHLDKIRKIASDIEHSEKQAETIRGRIDTRTELRTSLREGKSEINRLKKQLNGLTTKMRKYASIEYDTSAHQSAKAEYNRLKPIKEKAIRLETEAKRIPTLQKRANRLAATLSRLHVDIESCRKRIDDVGFDRHAYETSKKSRDQAVENYGNKRESLIKLQGELREIITAIEQNEQTINEEREKKKTIEEEEVKISSRSKLEKIMIDFRVDLISRIRPVLASRASELFRQMTKGKYANMDLDEDYDIKIEDGGQTFGIERFSGGEEDLANLCLRIAISQELSERSGGNRASFIALDEVFGSQDSERKGNILKALTELSNQFRQILLITHIDDIKESLPFVLNIKDDGNGAIKIEQEGIAVRIPVQTP